MDTKTALGAAGGISLTVAGAVSALVLTLGGGTASGEPAPVSDSVIEYVDQYGNPVSLEQQTPAVPEIVVTSEAPQGGADVEMMASAEMGEGTYEEGAEGEDYPEGADEMGEGTYEEDEHAEGEEYQEGAEYEEDADHEEDDEEDDD